MRGRDLIFHSKENEFRLVTWQTGLRMIKAHPLLGLGPEQIKRHDGKPEPSPVFMQYLPPDTPFPLPSGWYGHLHSIYLHYAAEREMPSAMLMLVWMLLPDAQRFFGKAVGRLPAGSRRLAGSCYRVQSPVAWWPHDDRRIF